MRECKEKSNKYLLSYIYIKGFNYELLDKKEEEPVFIVSIVEKAFKLGKLDAIIGDDYPSFDYQSDEQILERIHR